MYYFGVLIALLVAFLVFIWIIVAFFRRWKKAARSPTLINLQTNYYFVRIRELDASGEVVYNPDLCPFPVHGTKTAVVKLCADLAAVLPKGYQMHYVALPMMSTVDAHKVLLTLVDEIKEKDVTNPK